MRLILLTLWLHLKSVSMLVKNLASLMQLMLSNEKLFYPDTSCFAADLSELFLGFRRLPL
jgi:hypothetical protein